MRALIECAAECKVTLEERSDTTGVKGLYKQNYQRFNNIDAAKCFFVLFVFGEHTVCARFHHLVVPKRTCKGASAFHHGHS